jgi:hypothetical protein
VIPLGVVGDDYLATATLNPRPISRGGPG